VADPDSDTPYDDVAIGQKPAYLPGSATSRHVAIGQKPAHLPG
jgi:hypothetical protein